MKFLAIVSLATIFSFASALVLPQKRAGNIVFSCTVPNTAAITFDDGPGPWQQQIADILTAAGAKGTFFVNGQNFGCIYDHADSLRYVYNQGHQVASHTWSHADLATLSADDIANEIQRTLDAIAKITGATPAFTRPPFGSYNDQVLAVAGRLGQTVVNWDFDTEDSLGASLAKSESSLDTYVATHPPTVLFLSHETIESVIDLLIYAIEQLQAAGYELVTVAECLGTDAYSSVGTAEERDDTWTCSG